MQEALVEYIRDEDQNPHGCLVGKLVGDKVMIGVSVCRHEMDTFNKETGRMIAEGRIAAGRNSAWRKEDLRDALSGPIGAFQKRCARYFKTENVEVVGS